jgi:uncharacterized protein
MLTADLFDELNSILDIVRPAAPLADSPIHGEHHWQTVSLIGARLAADTPGANIRVAVLFGAIHDSRRENDHYDPEHGLRAAELLNALHASEHLAKEPPLLARLPEGVSCRDDSATTLDPAVGVCWDTDRLCLPRIGIEPHVDLRRARLSAPMERFDRHESVWSR